MNIVWASRAWADYVGWQSQDERIVGKINDLIADIRRNPFAGIGKPEPLKGSLAGWWSRRITDEHRLVYRVVGKRGEGQQLEILQCRFHY